MTNKYKKVLTYLVLPFMIFAVIFGASRVSAAGDLNIYLFWGNGCPHCAAEKEFLAEELPKYPSVKLNLYEIYYNQDNVELLQKVASSLDLNVNSVPFLIIGDKEFIGYSDGTTNVEITDRIEYCLESGCNDSVAGVINSTANPAESEVLSQQNQEKKEKIIDLPIIGKINAFDFSLPLLAIIIGALDGFNPCAMWTLLFLISLLMGLKSRRRMFILGSAFIVASSAVYFMFMAAWLQLILFLGFVFWVRLAIGAVAIAGGGHSLYSFFTEKGSGCKVTGSEKRQQIFERMKAIAQQNSLYLALGGIVLLAFAVNLVELVCSAGFPALFTQVLSLSELATWQYYAYIALYIFFFMLDDMIIFAIAMFTLQATGISTKYGRVSKLVGGILMLIIGLLLIFKPDLLMFG